MDMVDWTDLLERGLFNWCSAMVFYYPPSRKILASFVGLPEDGVYFATDHKESAYKYRFHVNEDYRIVKVSGPSDVRSLDSASIAFYGQKVPNFLSVYKHKRFLFRLRSLHNKQKRKNINLKTRIYNLAGNPMMMRLIDGHKKIDAIFDIEGQAPHDVVPGAYIAQKANAVFNTINRYPIDFHEILIKPAHPDSHIQYVLASSGTLCQEILQHLASEKTKRN